MTHSPPTNTSGSEDRGGHTAWLKFQNDFDAMTDAQVDDVTRDEQSKYDEAEEWLEAVALWDAAGRPRKPEAKA